MKESNKIIEAVLSGVFDGLVLGYECPRENYSEEESNAYRRGYDRGITIYCEQNHSDEMKG